MCSVAPCNPWTLACQAPLPMEFSRQEFWGGVPLPTLWDLPNSGIEPASLVPPALAGRFFTTDPVLEVTAKETMIAEERKIGTNYYRIHRGSHCWSKVACSGSLDFLKVAEVNRDGEYEIFPRRSGADKGAEAESSLKVKAGLLPTAGRALRTQTSVILTVTLRLTQMQWHQRSWGL